MKIICWNVNGIRAVQKKGFLDFIKEEAPDVLCLQETKAQPEQISLRLEGYEQFWNSAQKKGYAGTAVFTKVKPIKVMNHIGIQEHDQEARVITVEYGKFYLISVYVPNSGRDLTRLKYRPTWDRDFLNYLKTLEKKKPVIVCGDFNVAHKEIDLKNAKANYNKTAGYMQFEIDGMDKIQNHFIDTFRHFNKEPDNYTWWSYMFNARAKNVGWRIDYFFCSKSIIKKIISSEILSKVMGSDHCPIKIEVNY
ncbi:MAG TPA: exodeoxyribonuclease III [Candidatus Nanoarchaeia archaeon]|nr:exodeoxyribonuclease III [Candidatus Nanoarchaeia archaeon]